MYKENFATEDGVKKDSDMNLAGSLDLGFVSSRKDLIGYSGVMLEISKPLIKTQTWASHLRLRFHPHIASEKLLPFDLLERASIHLEVSEAGSFELGKDIGVGAAMQVDAFCISKNRIESLYWLAQFDSSYENCSEKECSFAYLYSPNLPSNNISYYVNRDREGIASYNLGSSRKNNFKFSYITPSINGLRVGASYIPQQGAKGVLNIANKYSDIFQYGIFYANTIGDLAYKFSISYEHANAISHPDIAYYPLNAIEGGVNLYYMGFTFGASIGSWGKSGQVIQQLNTNLNADYKTLGLGYGLGPFGVHIIYLNTRNLTSDYRAELNRLSLGMDYKFTNRLTSYFELSKFKMHYIKIQTFADNIGYMVLVGAKLKF